MGWLSDGDLLGADKVSLLLFLKSSELNIHLAMNSNQDTPTTRPTHYQNRHYSLPNPKPHLQNE